MSKARDIASASPAPSTVSATELGYLDGVSSAIQTQIDSKIGSASAISPTLIDAKGDLIVGSAADTAARLAVGTNDHVLTADSSATNGVKWAAPATPTGMPAVYAYQQYVQNPSGGVATKINYELETFDTNNNFASSRFTPTVAGYYLAYAKMPYTLAPTGNTAIYFNLYKNGSTYSTLWSYYPATANPTTVQGSSLVYMNGSTDYLEVYVSSGASGATEVGEATNYFTVVGIRS